MATGDGTSRTAGPLAAIVLAAGAGARFGGGKLMAPWRGGVLLDAALATAFATRAAEVIVATGADARIEGAARAFAERSGQAGRLRLVHAPDHAEGMGASLRAGARALPADCGGVFVFLGDMPRIPPQVLPRLIEALARGGEAAAPVFEGERGHPVLFGPGLIPALRGLTGDQGARAVLAGLGPAFVKVPVDDNGVLFDVDRPEALD